MKPLSYTLLLAFASAALISTLHGQVQRNWVIGPENNNWSNPDNWSTGVPDTNTESAFNLLTGNISINVDQNFTIALLQDGFAAGNTTVGGPGTLTIDRNSSNLTFGIQNATGNDGGLLDLTGSITFSNNLSAVTTIQNINSTSNTVRFAAGGTLTTNTTTRTAQGIGGQIQFNGTFATSLADLQIGSNNVSFGTGHNSSAYGRDVVLLAGSKLTVADGIVLNTGRKFQVNGDNAILQLDGANTINGANINVSGANKFTLDVNASQNNMGNLVEIGGNLTIDIEASVTALWFGDSSLSNWGVGIVTISGFKENVVRFGTDENGLTLDQLAVINGGAYSLNESGYLTAIPEPSAFAALIGLGALGFVASRRRRQAAN